MISQETIDKYKLDSDSLKPLFAAGRKVPKGKEPDLIGNLIRLVSDRQKEGRERCLSEYRKWAAVDMAYDTPLNQEVNSILRHILHEGGSDLEIIKALETWGLNPDCLFCKSEKTEGGVKKVEWKANFPLFYHFTIPLVRAYLIIRLANIFNERNTTPLFDYQPVNYNSMNRALCGILTKLVESITTNFGYPSTLRDWLFNALMYSVALKFPVESWVQYKQEGADGNVFIEKEGIRYVIPHVSKTYYDLAYPLHTLNTGTGCSYAGYWDVLRYGDVDANPLLWNKDQVPYGRNWLDPSETWYNYFAEVYPCSLEFPNVTKPTKQTNREKQQVYYNRNDYDKAFFIGYQFMELVPKDWGLGSYPNKIWMKFTIGADDIIMFAEAFRYRPVDQIGYDGDSGRATNVSLAQEIQPFQELTSNVFEQHLQTIKRNLVRLHFYNTDAIDKNQIDQLNGQPNQKYQNDVFVGFSGLKMEKAGNDMDKVIKTVNYTYADPTTLLQGLNTIIQLLERVLVVSSQEIGAAASHQQGNKEIEIINQSSNNRVAYTASKVDEGIDAWKRQIAEAAISYMSGNDVEAEIPADIPDLEKHLKEIGFKFKDAPKEGQKKVTVIGTLKKAKLIQFMSRRADKDRRTDMAASQAMSTAIAAIANNQLLSGLADPNSLFDLVTQSAILAGADDDFKVKLNKDAVMSKQLQDTIAKIQKMIMDEANKQIAAPVAKEIADQDAKIVGLQKALDNLSQLVIKATSPPATPPGAPPILPPLPPPNGNPVNQPPGATSAITA